MKELISRQAAIDYFVTNVGFCDEDGYPIEDTDELRKIWTEYFSGIPSAEPQIIYCKDCRKHNKRIGDYEELPVRGRYLWTEDACPLIEFRGKAQEHEFDYQFCAYAERRTE